LRTCFNEVSFGSEESSYRLGSFFPRASAIPANHGEGFVHREVSNCGVTDNALERKVNN
jgi:hypothetical protein